MLEASARQLPGNLYEEARLRRRMHLDALEPLHLDQADDDKHVSKKSVSADRRHFSEETVKEAKLFMQLSVQDRLSRVLLYLREKHTYCFWCGTQYRDVQDMAENCAGEDEEAHD